jgi:hypothetical protein
MELFLPPVLFIGPTFLLMSTLSLLLNPGEPGINLLTLKTLTLIIDKMEVNSGKFKV